MSELEIRRVVIACDAAADIRLAVDEAAAFAAQWRALLHGIYFEDENLYRLAELDVARHVTLSAANEPGAAAGETLKQMLPAFAAGMKRALESAAVQHRLRWSFGIQRVLPSAPVFREIAGDILIVEAGVRPFSGAWRPRSRWQSNALDAQGTVLLKRRRGGRRGAVTVVPRDPAAYERLLSAAFTMAAPEDEVVILSPDRRVEGSAERLAANRNHKFRVEPLPGDIDELLKHVATLDPSLLVLSATEAEPALRALAEGTQCDLLLVK